MRIYFDTSTLIKIYVLEANSPAACGGPLRKTCRRHPRALRRHLACCGRSRNRLQGILLLCRSPKKTRCPFQTQAFSRMNRHIGRAPSLPPCRALAVLGSRRAGPIARLFDGCFRRFRVQITTPSGIPAILPVEPVLAWPADGSCSRKVPGFNIPQPARASQIAPTTTDTP